jgi:hypothetical protein
MMGSGVRIPLAAPFTQGAIAKAYSAVSRQTHKQINDDYVSLICTPVITPRPAASRSRPAGAAGRGFRARSCRRSPNDKARAAAAREPRAEVRVTAGHAGRRHRETERQLGDPAISSGPAPAHHNVRPCLPPSLGRDRLDLAQPRQDLAGEQPNAFFRFGVRHET